MSNEIVTRRPIVRAPAKSPRHQRTEREILEHEIGLEVVEQALQFATVGEESSTEVLRMEDLASGVLPPQTGPPSKFRILLDRLQDPALINHSITQLMRDAGVNMFDLLDVVRKRDVYIAIALSSRRLGTVLDGLGEAAEPRTVECKKCEGVGSYIDYEADDENDTDIGEESLPVVIDCAECDGSGKRREMADIEAVKLMLKVHGLSDKGGAGGASGAQNVINVNQGVGVKVESNGDSKPKEPITTRVQSIIDQ